MPNFAKAALLATLGLALGGCSGGLTDTTELPAGVYALQTANGQQLPLVIDFIDSANQLELLSGSVSIVADGNFVDATTFRVTEAGAVSEVTEVASGQWSQNRSTITLTPIDGSGAYTMTLSGGTRLTQNFPDLVLIYVKE